jgi:hypothetical protein
METLLKLAFVVGFVALILGISAFMGWITLLVFGFFGVHLSFWAAWVIYIFLSSIFGRVSTNNA